MELKKIGKTDLKLSEITFGAWAIGGWMWGGNVGNDSIKAIRAAIENGVTSIDTAPIYGQGESELIVGEAIKNIPRDKVQIATKFGMRWDVVKGKFAMKSTKNDGSSIDIYKFSNRQSVIEECENSLKRLGTDYIDLYQIHWPDDTTPIEETFEAVFQLKREGKIREAGVCNYNVIEAKRANAVGEIASLQEPYSLVNRGIESDLVPYALQEDIAILAYSPLQRGLLTGKYTPGHHFESGDTRKGNSFYEDSYILKVNEFLEKIKLIALSHHVTLAQVILRWTLSQPGITVALAGARNEQQAIDNAAVMELQLSEEELKEIDKQIQIADL